MSAATSNHSRATAPTVVPARFSVEQFDQMLASGAFDKLGDQRIELFRGEVLLKSPPNPPHDYVLELLAIWAVEQTMACRAELSVRVQSSMDLIDSSSVSSPDLVIVRAQSYMQRRPGPDDTLLLVEVSDSSVAYDLKDKMKLYAEAGIKEYWVIDIPHRNLIIHLDPQNGRYCNVQTFREHTEVMSTVATGLSLKLILLFS